MSELSPKITKFDPFGLLIEYNTKIKTYADGSKKVKYTNYDISLGLVTNQKSSRVSTEDERERQKYKNLYKSKQELIDLAFHNSMITPWKYFVTFTFDDNRVDARDYNQVSKSLRKFIDNLSHQNKGIRYIIAPEPHKNGRIHFHGLFANVPHFKLEEARSPKGKLIYKNGCKIFNITNYKYGYTTCSEIKDQTAVSVYVSKYISKSLIDLNYKKRYWHSYNLSRPKVEIAHFNEDTLNFFISNNNLEVDYQSDTCLCLTSYNIHNKKKK